MIEPSRASLKIRYAIRDVTLAARQIAASGRRVLYLNIGDPNVYDFDLAPEACRAAHWALDHRRSSYAASEGLAEALEAIEADARAQGLSSIVGSYVGNGASECIDLALSALLNPEDNVLLPSPGYPLYSAILARMGVEARYYRLDASAGWAPDLADIEAKLDAQTRAIVLIHPNNPTGAVLEPSFLRRFADLALSRKLLILSDEIYGSLCLDERDRAPSLAALAPEANIITFSGLSKAYLGPGLRIGWGILTGPKGSLEAYYEAIGRLLRARLCANHPFQYAIKACLEGDQAHRLAFINALRSRRALCMRRIAEIPSLSCVTPKGTFYAFVRVEGIEDDAAWCRALLEETGVVVVPGSGFDYREQGCGYFRIVFLPDEAILDEAFDKIASFIEKRLS